MNILVLNSGSSSLKYKHYAMPREELLKEGNLALTADCTLEAAAENVILQCVSLGIDAVGHRVVHGGSKLIEPTKLTSDAVVALQGLKALDPLHNPGEISVIETANRLLPSIPAVAVLDTAFHHTLPDIAAQYALPWELSEKLELRRYGFHGISYSYVATRLLELIGRNTNRTRLIVCHLGSGASVCAIQDGKSIDTSMGFTPLEGLMMGTRCGDIDPGLLLYLLRTQNMKADMLDTILNKQSGLKGLSGISGDVRELEQEILNGNQRAELALAVFAYRVRKYIGAFAAALGGIDAIAFTGGIGEHSGSMRSRICSDLGFIGITLDSTRNHDANARNETRISSDESFVSVWMIPTNEELQIARDTFSLLSGSDQTI